MCGLYFSIFTHTSAQHLFIMFGGTGFCKLFVNIVKLSCTCGFGSTTCILHFLAVFPLIVMSL